MKIVNNTHWDTRQLRAILQCVAKQELESAKRRRVTVTVGYTGTRSNSCSGHAWLGGNSCTVRIPKGPRKPDPWTVEHYRKLDTDPSYLADKNIERHGHHLEHYLKHFDDEAALRVIKLDLAHVAGHEFAHLRGMTHRQMTPQYNDRAMTEKYYGWVLELPLEVKVKPKRTVDLQEQRYQRVLAAEKRWLSKLKAAQNKVKVYAGKRRYYEKAMAAKRSK
jgi:hypothetical protein